MQRFNIKLKAHRVDTTIDLLNLEYESIRKQFESISDDISIYCMYNNTAKATGFMGVTQSISLCSRFYTFISVNFMQEFEFEFVELYVNNIPSNFILEVDNRKLTKQDILFNIAVNEQGIQLDNWVIEKNVDYKIVIYNKHKADKFRCI